MSTRLSAPPLSKSKALGAAFRTLGFVATTIAVLYVYGGLSKAWTHTGGTHSQFMLLEVPLFLFATWICHVPLIGAATKLRLLLGWLLACLPPVLLFALLDGGYLYLHRCLMLSDFSELPALFDASPGLAVSVISVLGVTGAIPIVRVARFFARSSARARVVWLGSRVIAIAAFSLALVNDNSPLRNHMKHTVYKATWEARPLARNNGRFAGVLHQFVNQSLALAKLQKIALSAPSNHCFDHAITSKRNLYIVVLESFIDPRLLEGVRFDRSPLHPRMKALLGANADFDTIVSPVYGGGTAQTEFELLSGLPALQQIGNVEFNSLGANPVPSLISALRQQGYASIATVAARPVYYNAPWAYKSLGFEESYFFGDENAYPTHDVLDGRHMFDGDLLTQNLEFVSAKFLEHRQPFVNYVVGLYGHYPYPRNRGRRPDHCRLLPDGDGTSTLERVANQFYHRTGALASFIESVQDRDPTAIVFVTSDHLPPLLSGAVKYLYEPKRNICLMFDGKQRVRLSVQPAFHVPYIVYSRLCGQIVPVPGAAELQSNYSKAMAIGLGLLPDQVGTAKNKSEGILKDGKEEDR